MGNTVNKIPSINLPLTNESGTIHPIWYEFFRSFIAGVTESDDETTFGNLTAANGLTGGGSTGNNISISVGAGDGIAVNADSVAVDINGQVNAQAAVEDEILISDASDLSSIRKTSLQSLVNLTNAVPGGSDTEIQYNNNGSFDGDSNFTTDGAGTLTYTGNQTITGSLTVDDMTFNGQTITADSDAQDLTISFGTSSTGDVLVTKDSTSFSTGIVIEGKKREAILDLQGDVDGNTASAGDAVIKFSTDGTLGYQILLDDSDSDNLRIVQGSSNTALTVNSSDGTLSVGNALYRTVSAGITASTTQTQGQQPLTSEINEVSTVANPDDVVTLPSAVAGRYCLVIDNGASNLQIFPASGDDLGAGVNTSTTLTAASSALFVAYDATNWKQII